MKSRSRLIPLVTACVFWIGAVGCEDDGASSSPAPPRYDAGPIGVDKIMYCPRATGEPPPSSCLAAAQSCCCGTECCSGVCLDGLCTETCGAIRSACTVTSERTDCCSGKCGGNGCLCSGVGDPCRTDDDCCTLFCNPDVSRCEVFDGPERVALPAALCSQRGE